MIKLGGNGIFTEEELEILKNNKRCCNKKKIRKTEGEAHLNPSTHEYLCRGKTTTGVFRVHIRNRTTQYKRKYCYTYIYFDEEDKKRYYTSATIEKLKEKILKKGLEWKVIDEDLMNERIRIDNEFGKL